MPFRCALLPLVLATVSCITTTQAATLSAPFDADYTVIDLGAPAGVPNSLGGMTFLDANTLLIGGSANGASGAIYAIGVTRDPVNNFITGFSGPASLYASAPNIDGGLAFGPGGVLFYSAYPINSVGQIKPGSSAPDKIINLNTDLPPGSSVASSVGSLQFVPAGFSGAGGLKLISYNASNWYSAELTADGDGTFDITSVGPVINIGGGPEGGVFVSGANPGFGVDSILVSEYGLGRIGVYEADAQGDPMLGTRRDFITGLSGAEGAAIDPVTGDFLFSTFGGGDRVIVVSGFTIVPEPSTFLLMAFAALGILLTGWKRR